jgi:hypothetical protein
MSGGAFGAYGIGFTVVVCVAALFTESGSCAEVVTLAAFVNVPEVVGWTTIVTNAEAPLAMSPSVQTTVVVPVQLPWLAVVEMKVTPSGRVSVSRTALATPGPRFVAVIV